MTSTIRQRLAVGSLFFFHGLCCSSWASRIPSIQTQMNLSEASLGSLLFAIPVGSLLSMPLAAALVSRVGSRKSAAIAVFAYACFLISIGAAPNSTFLACALFLFGLAGNLVNMSINTQAVEIEVRLEKNLMSSMHGLWSLAGFIGASIGTFMIGWQVPPLWHFTGMMGIALIGLAFNYSALQVDRKRATSQSGFALPDRRLLGLGIVAFCSMLCEGAMFDWSGVYFQRVVLAEPAWIGMGYASFMSTMALTRLLGDFLIPRFGRKIILQISGLLIVAGLGLAVFWPSFWPCVLGFFMVGSGTALIVPLVFSEAGKSSTHSASTAIAAVSTVGFFGFLIGPPLIGWIAEWTSLRWSFALIAIMGFAIFLLARRQRPLVMAKPLDK